MDALLRSEARVPTTLPRRYLAQLCRHFQHRLPVTLTEDAGTIAFPIGPCTLAAEADALVMQVQAPDAEALAQVQGIVGRHLVRFGFRDELVVSWSNC